jgi:hypothetical protein
MVMVPVCHGAHEISNISPRQKCERMIWFPMDNDPPAIPKAMTVRHCATSLLSRFAYGNGHAPIVPNRSFASLRSGAFSDFFDSSYGLLTAVSHPDNSHPRRSRQSIGLIEFVHECKASVSASSLRSHSDRDDGFFTALSVRPIRPNPRRIALRHILEPRA